MKLLTHNFLSSVFLKGVTEGYPLILTATRKEIKQQEYNDSFIQRMIPKLNYNAFREAALNIGEGEKLPEQLPEKLEEELKNELHRLLVCVEVIEGELKCPESGRIFPIRDGIPNMLTGANETK
uniref:Multifunctional methyltransferase subunit TRM112-like protein n=1 Tax=Setaria digitata TaxID=48799 RepID=A0A915Q800_9BILA